MKGYFAVNTISEEERSNILSQHKTLYNGYQTMNPEIPNTQPLYVQDFAKDKTGAVMGNKGNIKGYTNMGINEQSEMEEGFLDNLMGKKHKKVDTIKYDGHKIDVWSDGDETLFGHPRKEGEPSSYTKHNLVYDDLNSLKRAIDNINKEKRGEDTGIEDWQNADEPMDMAGSAVPSFFPKPKKKIKNPDFKGFAVQEESFPYDKPIVSEGECSECGGMMQEGECSECGYKMEEGECSECGGMMQEGECSECGYKMEELDERTGKLDDIYDEEDLDPNAEFDYVKGASNKTNAFHVKEQMMKTPIGKISAIGGMEEQGGNADDMDVDDVEPAYNFDSNGPMDGGDVYPVNELDEDSFDDLINMDSELEYERDNLEQEGYEQMESAFADDNDFIDYNMGKNEKGQLPNPKKYLDIELDDDFVDYNMGKNEKGQLPNPKKYLDIELDEVDISGTQGVYGDVDPAYDFDSEGPGEGGPYQEYHGETTSDDDFDPTDKSWEEITQHTGGDEFGYVDEDIRESLIIQKNRIMEMMNRMKIIK